MSFSSWIISRTRGQSSWIISSYRRTNHGITILYHFCQCFLPQHEIYYVLKFVISGKGGTRIRRKYRSRLQSVTIVPVYTM